MMIYNAEKSDQVLRGCQNLVLSALSVDQVYNQVDPCHSDNCCHYLQFHIHCRL